MSVSGALRERTAPQAVRNAGLDVAVPLPTPFKLASGDDLPDGAILLRRFGAENGPQVVALGGISAGRAVLGETGWWRGVLGGAVDLDRFGVIGIDFAPTEDVRVRITPFDQARLVAHALTQLGIDKLHAFVGASYGGNVGLAFAALYPEKLERLCAISAAHRATAQALAWRGVQRRIVEFGLEQGEGAKGLSLARQLAMITYRSAEEFETRFGAGVDEDGRGELDRYLIARGDAYHAVMPPKRWLSLSEAIDRFDIEPGTVRTATTLIACPTDQLVPIGSMRDLAARLPQLAGFHEAPSLYGHDAFLKEAETIAPIIRVVLESSPQ